jgi:hypothetical protein
VVLICVSNTITCVSVFLLHVGFYGRLIALYKRNLSRVQHLSQCLGAAGADLRSWWHLRAFVLGEVGGCAAGEAIVLSHKFTGRAAVLCGAVLWAT